MAGKQLIRYMHTIEGQPGFFDGEQVCFMCPCSQRRRDVNLVCTSLEQIRREQAASTEYRERHKFGNDTTYGYVRIFIPV